MIHVSSEVGRLRRALVHEPGPEIDRMVPAMMEQLLFDDILFGEVAREEHGQLRRVMQLLGVEVLDAADLLCETLAVDVARDWTVDVVMEELDASERERLRTLSPRELTEVLVVGSRRRTATQGVEAEDLFEVPPLPNWCFQRDPQVILGRSVILASMASPARHREALLTRAIFRYHPGLRDTPVLFDPMEVHRDRPIFVGPHRPYLEGGDLLVLSPDVLVVGLSERTNHIAIRHLARALARNERGPRWLIVVDIPRRRAYMHLDTLITPVDRDACLIYPPVMSGGGREGARVQELDLHAEGFSPREHTDLLGCLACHGIEMEPIHCGGTDSVTQQREQWTDGSNALALAPGLITLFDRNRATAEELERHGFRIVEARDLLLGREEIDPDAGNRLCVLIASHELSRARGGPHCLVHPLRRDA